jgi:peptidoglycan/LPS O-acetylase OafA/YrhL
MDEDKRQRAARREPALVPEIVQGKSPAAQAGWPPAAGAHEQSTGLASPKYRSDIDGLRAVAVLSVVGFHAFPRWFPGGFVGVDVFFVISGFLISTIIFSSLNRGVFSFRQFYSRRIRRIFPALVIVLAACLLFGWLSLLSDEYIQLGKHVFGGAAFVSNFVLWNESGYFDPSAELKPLLHLWSLGIEEQFYILWPLLLYLAFKRNFNLFYLTMLIIFCSFYLNVSSVERDAVATFYSPAMRVWELLFGSVLAYVAMFRKGTIKTLNGRLIAIFGRLYPSAGSAQLVNIAHNVTAFLGIALITFAVFGMQKDFLFPGWWAVLPCAGALLLISAGPDAWMNRKVLSNRIMVFFGLISFPLYLWHWPLLSFPQIIEPTALVREIRIAAIIASVILAWLTYRLIEAPLRFGGYGRTKTQLLCTLMVGVAIIGVLAWQGVIHPLSSRFGLEKIVKARGEWEYPGPNLAPFDYQGQTFFLRRSNHETQSLYIGDSNMEQYGPTIDAYIAANLDKSHSAVFAALGACAPVPNVRDKQKPACFDFVAKAVAYARNPQVEAVVVGAQWFAYFSGVTPHSYFYDDGSSLRRLGINTDGSERAYKALEVMLSDFVKSGKRVYLVLNIPMGPAINPKNLVRRSLSSLGFEVNKGGMTKSDLLAKHNYGDIRRRLLDVAKRSGATAVDPLDYLCVENVCPSVTEDGEPIYKDGAHIRPFYARTQVRFLDATLQKN